MNKPEALPPDYASFLPEEVAALPYTQSLIPAIAKDAVLIRKIEGAAHQIPTWHRLWNADARAMQFLAPDSVHLVVTSPPYWVLKEYHRTDGQLGFIEDYEAFLLELDRVWQHCYDALVPGGRLVCVVGDVCLSRRKNAGGRKGPWSG